MDDTLIYLNKNDKIKDMEDIIEVFCKASTAKFNLEKTEALPIGSKEHWENIIKKRSMGENNQIPDHVNLIKDGDAMRTLGAWVGNGINIEEKWKTIIMKQQKIMNTWKKSRPTFRGKELILKALTTSKAGS